MEETNINFTFILSFNPPASHGGRYQPVSQRKKSIRKIQLFLEKEKTDFIKEKIDFQNRKKPAFYVREKTISREDKRIFRADKTGYLEKIKPDFKKY